MVATHGSSELSDVKLKLPPTREQWLTVEQQIRAVAIEKELLSILEGTYIEKPLFPVIPVKRWAFEMQNVPIDPTNLALGNHNVNRLDVNGERIFRLDAAGDRILEAEYMSELCPDNLTSGEMIRLHQEKLS